MKDLNSPLSYFDRVRIVANRRHCIEKNPAISSRPKTISLHSVSSLRTMAEANLSLLHLQTRGQVAQERVVELFAHQEPMLAAGDLFVHRDTGQVATRAARGRARRAHARAYRALLDVRRVTGRVFVELVGAVRA